MRWSDTQLLALNDRAVKSLVAEIRFPETRLTAPTSPNTQEYQLPDTHVIKRVYLNGQIVTRTPGNISTLQGEQILFNDQTGMGPTSTGAPPGSGGVAQPKWTVQTPTSYPFLNNFGPPVTWGQPWFPNQNPRWYVRGGSIGIVPAPGNIATLAIEGVLVPPTLTSPTQAVVVPDVFADAIDFYVISRCWASDKDELSQQMASAALANYDKEVRKLRTWKRQYTADDDALLPLTGRGFYTFGNNRTGGDGWGGNGW